MHFGQGGFFIGNVLHHRERCHHIRGTCGQGNRASARGKPLHTIGQTAGRDFPTEIRQKFLTDIHARHLVEILLKHQGLCPVSATEIDQMTSQLGKKRPDQTRPALKDELPSIGRYPAGEIFRCLVFLG